MKTYVKYPQTVYIPELDNADPSSVSPYPAYFDIVGIRDHVTGTEQKFLRPRNFSLINSAYFFPCNIDFLKKHIRPFYLKRGNYECQLQRYVTENGAMPSFPLPRFDDFSLNANVNVRNLNPYNFNYLQTIDGQYVVWVAPLAQYPRDIMSYGCGNLHRVITRMEDFNKVLNPVNSPFDFWSHDNLTARQNVGYSKWDATTDDNITIEVRDDITQSTNTHSKCCYKYDDNATLTWQSSEISPPNGFDLFYNLKTGEHWMLSNELTELSNYYRFPGWTGETAIYICNNGNSYLQLDRFSYIKYDDSAQKWKIYTNSGIARYETDMIASSVVFDNSQVIHFHFLGTPDKNLSDKQQAIISAGLDFMFKSFFDILSAASLPSFFRDESAWQTNWKSFLRDTGKPDFYYIDYPSFQ